MPTTLAAERLAMPAVDRAESLVCEAVAALRPRIEKPAAKKPWAGGDGTGGDVSGLSVSRRCVNARHWLERACQGDN